MTYVNTTTRPPHRMVIGNAKRAARRARDGWRRFLKVQVSKRPLVAGLYYAFFNREMLRESMAVAAGQVEYAVERDEDGKPSYYLLRRNIHRIEKGLIMRPRRASFGADYIEETVKTFARAVAQASLPWSPELRWAADVLKTYFATVDASPAPIAAALRRYNAIALPREATGEQATVAVPYARDLSAPPSVDFDSLMALARRRRSVRWYRDDPVSREAIDKALLLAAQAPSACNRQPFHFRIFDQKADVARISAIPMGTRGFSEQFPAVAVVVGQLRAYPYERDRHAIYIDSSLAVMSFVLALETMGMASCVINWPDQEPHESKMKAALSLADDERVIMLVAFGWPDVSGQVPYSAKRDIAEIRSYG